MIKPLFLLLVALLSCMLPTLGTSQHPLWIRYPGHFSKRSDHRILVQR